MIPVVLVRIIYSRGGEQSSSEFDRSTQSLEFFTCVFARFRYNCLHFELSTEEIIVRRTIQIIRASTRTYTTEVESRTRLFYHGSILPGIPN